MHSVYQFPSGLDILTIVFSLAAIAISVYTIIKDRRKDRKNGKR
jgi:hypothetical protein